jgi:hypothetical protein
MIERVQTLIDNDAVARRYHPELRIVHHELRRFVRGDEIRSVLETGLMMLQKHRAYEWLSDDRGNSPLI